MKSMKLIGTFSLLLITAACGSGMPDYDATGTFERPKCWSPPKYPENYFGWM